MSEVSNSSSETILKQVQEDNVFFKDLLDLIPPHSYFSNEEKQEIYGTNLEDEEDDGKSKKKKKKKKKKGTPLSTLSVTQIAELRLKGETLGEKKKKPNLTENDIKQNGIVTDEGNYSLADKQKNKKVSRSSKSKKKGKELQRRESRLEELKEKLRLKLEEIKARKSLGNSINNQEEKKLKRQEKKVRSLLKNKDKSDHKTQQAATAGANGLKSSLETKILNQNGMPVKSKFDFSIISFGNERNKSSNLQGRDYKRLLEKVERKNEKVEKLKEKDPEAGRRLEKNIQWHSALSRAKGEKVKDDPSLLKKAAKRKDKLKEKKQKQWGARVQNVEEVKQKRQDKRQTNIDKRKDAKKDKKKKLMIKKGRIIPGF